MLKAETSKVHQVKMGNRNYHYFGVDFPQNIGIVSMLALQIQCQYHHAKTFID